MLKLLIIYAHPSHDGSHAYFLDQIQAILKTKEQIDYELIDLYAIKYDPVLDNSELYSSGRRAVTPENQIFQNKIKAADRLLFIYPTWWQNMPAILKGFMDRIFVGGFAFTYKAGVPIGLLKGKKAAAFSATGGPRVYTSFFTGDQSLRVLTKDILAFAGIKSRGFSLGSARRLTEADKPRLKRAAEKTLKYLLD
jgi:NAD(P)H dehydrogenase (quinone)